MSRSNRRLLLRRLLAVLLLAHVLAVVALAASPRLHHWVHPDADDDDHDCAVVLFTHGQVDDAPTLPLLAVVAWLLGLEFVAGVKAAAFVPSAFALSQVLEHAPPAAA